MWAVVVYPPLVVPLRIGLPDSCPRCGTTDPLHVHERLTRRIACVDRTFRHGDDWPLVGAYETVRFRCPRCRKITGPRPPSSVPGFRFQRMIAARLLSAYCFGEAVDSIRGRLDVDGITVDRATAYRFLERFADDEVEALRSENRPRARRARRPDLALGHFGYFRADISDRAANMGPKLQLGAEDDPDDGSTADLFLDMYRFVDVLRLYNDEPATATMRWLTTYLDQQGSAGVIFAASLRDLERRFDPYGLRIKKRATYTTTKLAMTSTQLYGPLDITLPVVRETIEGALRVAVWWVREREPGTSSAIPEHRLHNYP